MLLEAGVSPDVSSADGRTALTEAAAMGQTDAVRLLLEAGADTTLTDAEGAPALVHAARNGRIEAVRVLLEAGADPNGRDKYRRTALMGAARAPFPEVVKMLLACGARANDTDIGGETALTAAIQCGNPAGRDETTAMLLDAGADVTAADQHGRGPIHAAAGLGSVTVLESLLARGADIHAPDRSGLTPLMHAFSIGHPKTAAYLIEQGASMTAVDASGRSVLHYAASTFEDRCAGSVRSIVRAGAKINAVDTGGSTPLSAAASRGNVESARVLLEHGADVHIRTAYGDTPAGASARAGSADCLRLLIDFGADISVVMPSGQTLLHRAVQAQGDAAGCVEVLMAHGADPRAEDDQGRTPVDVAADLGRPELVSIMTGGETPERSHDKPSYITAALHEAVKTGDVGRVTEAMNATPSPPEPELVKAFLRAADAGRNEIVAALIEGGLIPHCKGPRGLPLILECVLERRINPSAVSALIAAGADPTVTTENRATLLIFLCGLSDDSFYSDRPVVYSDREHELLEHIAGAVINAGVNPSASNDDGEAPLYWAVLKRRVQMVRLLLARGADPDTPGPRDVTPLMRSASRGDRNLAVTEMLLTAGADPTMTDATGRTAKDYAMSAGGSRTAALFTLSV